MTGDGKFLERLVKLLSSAGISYMIAGSVASNLYGHPRTTNDVDIVIAASESDLNRLLASLGDLYSNARSGRQAINDGMFNVIDFSIGMKADIILVKDRDFSRVEFARRRIADVDGVQAFVVSAEDAILSKLEWCKLGESERQFRDAFNIAALMWDELDMPHLKKWAVELNVVELLTRLLAEAQPRLPAGANERCRSFKFEPPVLRLPVYMDNHATTRVDPRVLEAMLPYLGEVYGNAGSTNHSFGLEARDAVEAARQQVAAALGASPAEIVFTSGATESNNLAIFGVAERPRRKGNHIVSVCTEHNAVLDPLAHLAGRGFEVTLMPVEPNGSPTAGLIAVDDIAAAIRDETVLVSVMMANNEIGVIQPIDEIGRVCKQRGVLFHCDATQAIGKLPVDVDKLNVDLLSLSAHKIYGPKGTGALYVRRRNPIVRLEPQIFGGGQERGFRSGTLNVPGIVGLGHAIELALGELAIESVRLATLRRRLYDGLTSALDDVSLNGPALERPDLRLPGNLNMAFAYVQGEALLLEIKELAVSSGAACTSARPEPSHVLRALGLDEDTTKASLRFGLGRFNTEEEVDFAVEQVAAAVVRLRKLSSLA